MTLNDGHITHCFNNAPKSMRSMVVMFFMDSCQMVAQLDHVTFVAFILKWEMF